MRLEMYEIYSLKRMCLYVTGKFFIYHNTGITIYDLLVNLLNMSFFGRDESESDEKASCVFNKTRGISHSSPLHLTYVFVREQLLVT